MSGGGYDDDRLRSAAAAFSRQRDYYTARNLRDAVMAASRGSTLQRAWNWAAESANDDDALELEREATRLTRAAASGDD